jgi:hypothetical protein
MLKISHVRTVPKSNLKVVGTEVKPIPLTRKQASSAPVEKTVRHQDISEPVEQVSSAPRHFGTVEKKGQIGIAFSFKQT